MNLITIEEYAKMCGVTTATIYGRIRNKIISSVKKGSATFIDIDVTEVMEAKRPGRTSAKNILKNSSLTKSGTV